LHRSRAADAPASVLHAEGTGLIAAARFDRLLRPETEQRMSPPRRTKSGVDSVTKGNTGEFYALAELSRHGWTAAQTPRNSRVYDILAKKGSRRIDVRVKTKTSDARVFQWNAKDDGSVFVEISDNDFCILVDIPEAHDQFPLFYVVPTQTLHEWLSADFKAWLETPGPIKAQRSAENRRRLFYMDDDKSKLGHGYRIRLNPYLGNWKSLEGPSSDS
jgi:hypothetical protein